LDPSAHFWNIICGEEHPDVTQGKMTLVPTSGDHPTRGDGEKRLPTLRILFHPDLHRIGGATPCGLFTPGQELVIGRLEPGFLDPDGGPSHPLDDPCISREQLSVTWTSADTFAIRSIGARQIELLRLDGSSLSAGQAAGPGTVIAIGDRALLLLEMGCNRQGQERLGLDGDSELMWSLRNKISGAAVSDSTVLVHGESGVGKELVARAIHDSGARRDQPWLVLNCAAIPENLLESELFGHVRGAFTGADADKIGLFRAAEGGTLFLDEIGELPLALQGKMLRVLQEHAVRPVGGVTELPVQARVIAATNRDLGQEVTSGRFREDLYYRLTTLMIQVPPLRQRREDIPQLFCRLFAECTRRHPELERFWCPPSQHTPPLPMSFVKDLLTAQFSGNVRHLRNIVERCAVANLQSKAFAVPQEVRDELLDRPLPSTGPDASAGDAREIDDKELLLLLEQHDYVQRRVAQVLGVSHTTIDRRMRELGLRRPKDIPAEELEQAAVRTGNDLDQMARLLKVSRRGLKLRLTALGMLKKDQGT
jgi:DNA-binding NtrC family response regulator